MKKLVFGLIATMLFSFAGNAQKATKESVRYSMSEGMASMVEALKPAYKTEIHLKLLRKQLSGVLKTPIKAMHY